LRVEPQNRAGAHLSHKLMEQPELQDIWTSPALEDLGAVR